MKWLFMISSGLKRFGIFFATLIFSLSASYATWNVLDAPARFILERDAPEKTAKVSSAKIWLPVSSWSEGPVHVFNEENIEVGAEILWKAQGEPVTLVFDTSSGGKYYYVYFGSSNNSKPKWSPQAGVILETRAWMDKSIGNVDEMLREWNKSTKVYGKSLWDSIFTGGHVHDYQTYVMSHYQGWFEVEKGGKYLFATISTDASFVLVDGKQIVAWPGKHHFYEGRWGKFQAGVDLTPGVHTVDFYNAFQSVRNKWPILCALSVKPAEGSWKMLMPDSNFFIPIGKAKTSQYELMPSDVAAALHYTPDPSKPKAPAYAMEWETTSQSIPSWEDPEVGFISTQFRLLGTGDKASAKWSFDDKGSADGAKVERLFPRPGLRKVKVSVKEGGTDFGELELTVGIHANWNQMVYKKPEMDPKKQEIMLARAANLSATDFAGVVGVFVGFEDSDSLLKLLPVLSTKLKEFSDSDWDFFMKSAVLLVDGGVRRYGEAEKLLRAVIQGAQSQTTPAAKQACNEARLALGQILLKTTDRRSDVQALVQAIDTNSLSNDDKRALAILKADLTLANGDIPSAKQQYLILTGEQSGADARSSVRRTAKIDQANSYLRNKELDAVDRVLTEIEWKTPIEKLAADYILLELKLLKERGDSDAALYYAKRMLPVVTSMSFRSEILFQTVDLAMSRNDNELAMKSLKELVEKHPYSEATAQAKMKWKQEIDSIK